MDKVPSGSVEFRNAFRTCKVSIRGMGVGEVVLPPIEDPIEFRKAVQEARMISEKGGNTSGQEVF